MNWRAYLRLEKMFLKMFQLEPRIPVRVLLDVSRSMTTGGEQDRALEIRLCAEVGRGDVLCGAGAVGFDLPPQPFADKLGDPLRLGGGRQSAFNRWRTTGWR